MYIGWRGRIRLLSNLLLNPCKFGKRMDNIQYLWNLGFFRQSKTFTIALWYSVTKKIGVDTWFSDGQTLHHGRKGTLRPDCLIAAYYILAITSLQKRSLTVEINYVRQYCSIILTNCKKLHFQSCMWIFCMKIRHLACSRISSAINDAFCEFSIWIIIFEDHCKVVCLQLVHWLGYLKNALSNHATALA